MTIAARLHDFVLTGGHVIDPSTGTDGVIDVAFTDGRISGLGKGLSGRAQRDVSGAIVTPGLIDLHTHVYWGGTSLGVEPDLYSRKCAVTTMADTGSAGPGNFPGFRKHVIAPAQARVLVFLHVSFAGIYAFSSRIMVGESHDLRLMAPAEAIETARANSDLVAGIKVRLGRHASGPSGILPLDAGLEAADATGLPLMVHIDEPPPSYEEVVDRMRPGDILTHCFRPDPNAPLTPEGGVKEAVLAARARGVLFDVGHGMGSFSWQVARGMLAQGFAPDTISSDVHALCIDGPAHDLLHTMTKFLALGLSLKDVIRAATIAPAQALRRPDLGTFAIGATGDASVIALRDTPVTLTDVRGEVITHHQHLVPQGMVIGGAWQDTGA